MDNFKKYIIPIICIGVSLGVAGCGSSDEKSIDNDIINENTDSTLQFEIPKEIDVIGDNRVLPLEQAETIAYILDDLQNEYQKVAFLNTDGDNISLVFGKTENEEHIGRYIDITSGSILQWSEDYVELMQEQQRYYMTDIIEENGEYLAVFQYDLRYETDELYGWSTISYGFENGFMKIVPSSYSITLSNIESSLTFSSSEDFFNYICNPVELKKLVDLDTLYEFISETNTEKGIKKYKIDGNGNITDEPSLDIEIMSNVETFGNSVLNIVDQTGDYWYDIETAINILNENIEQTD